MIWRWYFSFRPATLALIFALSTVQAEQPNDTQPMHIEPLAIKFISLVPRELEFSKKVDCAVKAELSKPATLKLSIYDWDGDLVAERTEKCEAGTQTITWDGRFEGREPTDGPYTFRLEANTSAGEHATYAPSVDTALQLIEIREVKANFKTGEMQYTLPKLGMVRVRILHHHMLVRTLQNWTPRLAGKYTLHWDGKDQSGNDISSEDPKLDCMVLAYSLPENTVIVSGTGKTKAPRGSKEQLTWRNTPAIKKGFFHASVPREKSNDPEVKLKLFQNDAKTELAEPFTISTPVKVRMQTSPTDAVTLIDERFEICVYIDGEMIFEDEDGVVPFTFDFSPVGVNNGLHLLSVMALSTADHLGVGSQVITVNNAATEKNATPEK